MLNGLRGMKQGRLSLTCSAKGSKLTNGSSSTAVAGRVGSTRGIGAAAATRHCPCGTCLLGAMLGKASAILCEYMIKNPGSLAPVWHMKQEHPRQPAATTVAAKLHLCYCAADN